MAPWIRINGSLNRRVLDKYLGTVLLYCIENTGLTLFSLCTRFYYLTPVHMKELVEYLQDMGCVKTISFAKKAKVSLFSSYESMEIGLCLGLHITNSCFYCLHRFYRARFRDE